MGGGALRWQKLVEFYRCCGVVDIICDLFLMKLLLCEFVKDDQAFLFDYSTLALTSLKTNMTMEKQPFEDVSPTNNGVASHCPVSFERCKLWLAVFLCTSHWLSKFYYLNVPHGKVTFMNSTWL